jgi:hypothetical protein
MFIAKLDGATGCAIWKRRFGSSSEDTIRSVAVRPDGTIVSSYRTDDGVELRTARCP